MKVKVNGTSISASERCSLTEGNINSLYVDFEYSPEWENLIKTAVFANGTASISVPITASRHAIPWEVLAHTGELYVSLRGSTDGGNVVRTTGNAFLGRVQSSLAAVIGEATPNVIDVLMAEVADHEERITELEEHGSGGGGDKFIVKLTNNGGESTADKTFDEIAAAHEAGKTVELWIPSSSDVDIGDSHDVLYLFEYHNSEEAKSIIFSNAYSEAVLQIFVVSENGTDTWDIAMASIPTDTEKAAWNGKQDALIAGTGITIAADGKTISATAQDVLEVIYTKGAFDPQTLTYEYSCNKTLSAIIAAISGGKIHVRHYETANNVMPVYTELTCSYNDVSGILAIFSGIDRENNLITVTHSKPTPISSESITVTRTALAKVSDIPDLSNYVEKDDLDDYVAISQGVAHAGKFLVVGDDGNVTTQTLPIYDGSVI